MPSSPIGLWAVPRTTQHRIPASGDMDPRLLGVASGDDSSVRPDPPRQPSRAGGRLGEAGSHPKTAGADSPAVKAPAGFRIPRRSPHLLCIAPGRADVPPHPADGPAIRLAVVSGGQYAVRVRKGSVVSRGERGRGGGPAVSLPPTVCRGTAAAPRPTPSRGYREKTRKRTASAVTVHPKRFEPACAQRGSDRFRSSSRIGAAEAH